MKRGIFTSVAVVAAFLAGMSVYVACGSSDNGAIADLQAEIRLIKTELEALKASCGEFEVDGLYFNRAGEVTSKCLRYEYGSDLVEGYSYDENGRLVKLIIEDTNGRRDYEYLYSKKIVTVNVILYNINGSDKVVESKYYY